jgi:hypothetical protein
LSSGISTTTARSPAVGTGAGGTADVAVAAAVAAASCRDPVATTVPRGGSLVAAALPTARGAFDKRRLVGTDASDLSPLAGARAGRSMPPCERRNTRLSSNPSKSGAPGERATHLKLEKPRFLFLEGSGGTATTPVVATATLADAPTALAGASVARAASSTDCPVAGASGPAAGACSSTASAALGDRGGGFHLCRSPLPPPPPTNSPESPGGSPCCSRGRYSSLSCSRQPHGLGAWAGQTARRPPSPSTKKQPSRPRWCATRDQGGKGSVDAKCAPSAKHTASRTSWLHTRKESRDVPVNFP